MITSSKRFIDENKRQFDQFLQFLLVNYLIDHYFIIFYRKKNFDQFHPNAISETISQNRKIL